MKMTRDNPLVTIYLPTFNRVDLLQRAVDSVLNQTYKNIELIIVDDCSKDETPSYLYHLARQDSRVRIHIKSQNSGACESRNIAIEMARGDYITGLDDDDYFLPDRIDSFITHVGKLAENAFLVSRYYFLYPKNRIKRSFSSFLMKSKYGYNDMLYGNLAGNQVFIRTQKLKDHSFDAALPMWQDYDLWLRLLRNDGNFYIIKNRTYVVDVSHKHGRISHKKQESLATALKIIVEKNGLNGRQQKMLTMNFAGYGYVFSFLGTLYMLKSNLSVFTIYYFLRLNLVTRWRCRPLLVR